MTRTASKKTVGGKPVLSAKDASAILAEYPDADLSKFHVEGDVEELAAKAFEGTMSKIADKLSKKRARA